MRWVQRVAAATVVLIAPAVVLIARLVWNPDVPNSLPTHWDSHGQVDGTTGQTAFFWICLIISGGLALIGAAAALHRKVTRSWSLVAATAFGAWLLAAGYVMVLNAAQGAARPQQVHVPWQTGIGLLVVAAAAALAMAVMLPRDDSPEAAVHPPPSTMRLRAGERVTWVGAARSRVLATAAALLALAAIGCAFVSWPPAIALLVAALGTAWAHQVTVRIDDLGVHTLWGPARWPRTTIPLSMIDAARAEDINPAQWGGWGYRVTPRGRAAIVRKGSGLVVHYGRNGRYAVTVDRAGDAADVVNALMARAHDNRP